MGRAPAMAAEDRRAAIVAATLPLLLQQGPSVSTTQIARAAGIAEGTIFRVFPDKDAVVRAAVEHAFDPGPTEAALAGIDRTLPFAAQLAEAVRVMQRRLADIWRLVSAVGDVGPRGAPDDFAGLVALFAAAPQAIRVDPVAAARQLRAVTLALSHPLLYPGEPMDADDVVALLLHGITAP